MSAKDLGNPEVLAKIDRLRELNVGSLIQLPQLVVVGDQSSGKSSVLESLTGFSFPRATTLCTRYATQIRSRRDPAKSVRVSIIPRPDADDKLKMRLLGFQREFTELNNEDLANDTMGIASKSDDTSEAFSQDILKIEINGPEEIHLTVIDVPGIFRVATPGITKETDPALVESMVKSYMRNSRTVILAVIPCNIDAATQEILKFASEADPKGNRTMGVLTKPDLVSEAATRETVMDLLQGRRSKLELGYFVVKNRSADDNTSSFHQRAAAEAAFFAGYPWADATGRCGVAALRERLRQLLLDISNKEFPHLKAEVQNLLRSHKSELQMIGSPRADEASQRMHLGKLATRFQTIVRAALSGNYASDRIFHNRPDLKLITKIMKLNETFSDTFWHRGHQHHFSAHWSDEGDTSFGQESAFPPSEVDIFKYDELCDVIEPEVYECPKPSPGTIRKMIQDVYESSRGPELGTYGGTMLWTVFEQQSEKWVPLALSHIGHIISLLHDFISCLLDEICQEKQIKTQIWEELLAEKLIDAYRKAMEQTRFLLELERGTMPSTLNHYFNATLQRKRAERISHELEDKQVSFNGKGAYIPVDAVKKCAADKGNGQHVCDGLLDSLAAYYKVSRKRFVDVLDQQVVSHLLLSGEGSALQIFGPEMVMGLDCNQLQSIAKEDEESRKRRHLLEREVERLEAALVVIRS
ncbi:unnamed protein product [Fusarium langsethiae]|nr:unnamed protein product [Fusarium langsethiae]